MKKIIAGWTVILLLTVTFFCVDSRELSQSIPVKEPNQRAVLKEEKGKPQKNYQVRIVILEPERKQKNHGTIRLKGDPLKIYYGKNFSEVTEKEELRLDKDSQYFKERNLMKIEGGQGVEFQRSPGETVRYYGVFYIYRENNGLVLVNQVDLERYVAGVISSEIGVNVPKEAMKAQAVCARTYITSAPIKYYKKYKAQADDSTDYQVYNRQAPNKQCYEAAVETKNLLMTHHRKPITAYYFSTSCGYTTDYRIWGRKKLPYLAGCSVSKHRKEPVKNFEQFIRGKGNGYEKEEPYFRWNCFLSSEQIENSVYLLTGVDIGNFENAQVNERGVGGIASQITIYGDQRQVVVNNQMQIRKMLSSVYMTLNLQDGTTKTGLLLLPSAFIAMDTVYDGRVVSGLKIYGGGFGHGSGMSQNGAIAMAKAGKNYKEILGLFYRNIKLEARNKL